MKTLTTGDALRSLELELIRQGRSVHTIRAYRSDCMGFFSAEAIGPDLPDQPRLDFRARHYIDSTIGSASPATTRRRMASIRALGTAVGYRGVLADYKGPYVGRRSAHPLPNMMDDVRAMLDVCRDPEHKAFVALCGMAGLRSEECRSIRPSSINRHTMELRVVGKGRKERHVPITDELLAILDSVPRAATDAGSSDVPYVLLSDRSARRAFTSAGRRAGIARPVASHDGRMTFGTATYEATGDIRTTQELLGHASVTTSENYTRVRDTAKRRAVEVALS